LPYQTVSTTSRASAGEQGYGLCCVGMPRCEEFEVAQSITHNGLAGRVLHGGIVMQEQH
jgi:hypothetical protein